MGTMNFAIAKLKHQTWKLRLRAFMDGREEIKESEAVSPRECDLGKWLYGEGLTTYRSYPEMQKLEQEHSQMHSLVKQIILLKHQGHNEQALKILANVNSYSDRVVGLLSALESKINH